VAPLFLKDEKLRGRLDAGPAVVPAAPGPGPVPGPISFRQRAPALRCYPRKHTETLTRANLSAAGGLNELLQNAVQD